MFTGQSGEMYHECARDNINSIVRENFYVMENFNT